MPMIESIGAGLSLDVLRRMMDLDQGGLPNKSNPFFHQSSIAGRSEGGVGLFNLRDTTFSRPISARSGLTLPEPVVLVHRDGRSIT